MSKSKQGNAESQEVGYGRPPKHGQFKKGQSGNPKGRKKGVRSMEAALRSAMLEKVTVQTAKGSRKITKLEAAAQLMINKALSGDASDRRLLVTTMRDCGMQLELAETIDAHQADQLMDEDRAILARYSGNGAAGYPAINTNAGIEPDGTDPAFEGAGGDGS